MDITQKALDKRIIEISKREATGAEIKEIKERIEQTDDKIKARPTKKETETIVVNTIDSFRQEIAETIESEIEDIDISLSDAEIDNIVHRVTAEVTERVPTRTQIRQVSIDAVNAYMGEVLGASGLDPKELGGGKLNLMKILSGVMGKGNPAPTDKPKNITPEKPSKPKDSKPECAYCGEEYTKTMKPYAKTVHGINVPVIKCEKCTSENICIACPVCGKLILEKTDIKPGEHTKCPGCGTNMIAFPEPQET